MAAALRHLKSRLGEKSSWAGIVAAVSGGALLPAPYSWLAIAAGIIGVLVPEAPKP
jgi:hypothetical protein